MDRPLVPNMACLSCFSLNGDGKAKEFYSHGPERFLPLSIAQLTVHTPPDRLHDPSPNTSELEEHRKSSVADGADCSLRQGARHLKGTYKGNCLTYSLNCFVYFGIMFMLFGLKTMFLELLHAKPCRII